MAWVRLKISLLFFTVFHLLAEDRTSIRKCRIVGDDSVVCTLQKKELDKSTSHDHDDPKSTGDVTDQEEEAELTERASRWGVTRRVARRRTSPKCYIAASTIQCDDGLKLNGVGTVGKQGNPGLPGPKGEKGGHGSPGRPGPDGKQGPRGFRGSKGNKGLTGEKGETGDPGRGGHQGAPGIPSNCDMLNYNPLTCPLKGPPGRSGLKGSTGEEGPVGAKGDKGARGAKGIKGARGAAGMPGSIGLYGALRLKKPCRQMYSPWVVPYVSPIGQLKTECAFREYLLSLEIEPHSTADKIRYNYKCCPFKASDLGRTTLL